MLSPLLNLRADHAPDDQQLLVRRGSPTPPCSRPKVSSPAPQRTTDESVILCCIFNEHLVKPRSAIDSRPNPNENTALRIAPICRRSGCSSIFRSFHRSSTPISAIAHKFFFAPQPDFPSHHFRPDCRLLSTSLDVVRGPLLPPLTLSLPCRSVSSVANPPTTNLALLPPTTTQNSQPTTPNAAHTGPLYQYDLQKPQTSCINLLRSNRYRHVTKIQTPNSENQNP